MSRSAARSIHRRPPGTRGGRARRLSGPDRERFKVWLPPLLTGFAMLSLYVLGALDVIGMAPAMIGVTLLLCGTLLYFPLRYAYRLPEGQRWMVALLVPTWFAGVFLPIYFVLNPGPRIAGIEFSPGNPPATLAAGGRTEFDLVASGRLPPGENNLARFRIGLRGASGEETLLSGNFLQIWQPRARGRGEAVDALRSQTAVRYEIENASGGDLTVLSVEVEGRLAGPMNLSLFPPRNVATRIFLPIGGLLLVAAVLFDRATGTGATASSLSIATGAALTASFSFGAMAPAEATFRELFGASIIGALAGGPIGGLALWIASRQSPANRRARPRVR